MEGSLHNGKYTILHEVGQGGMAVVYKGIDNALDREVAVKVLHPHLANRADSRMRLQREAKAVAKLHHPNILEIYDYSGLDTEESYIVTEYIRGETLKDFTDRHTPSLPEVGAMVVREIASALAHAHEQGIIHRDIKPENIMIRDDGVLKLMDFGIAQILEMAAMTVTGALVGSPAHMSPEHVEGKPLDFRADVFSLGTLLYFLAAGRLPFDSPSPHALLRQILEATYDDPRMHNPAISRALHAIIARCLERDPDCRFDTVTDLVTALDRYLEPLGLVEPAAELALYFEEPSTVEAGLTQRVVDRLMLRAQESANSGKVAAALEAYNQVLSLQGDREDALAQVRRLSTSRSRRARARWVGLAALIATGIAALVFAVAPGTGLHAREPDLSRHAAVMPITVAVTHAPRPAQSASVARVAPSPAPTVSRPPAPIIRPRALSRPALTALQGARPRRGVSLTIDQLDRQAMRAAFRRRLNQIRHQARIKSAREARAKPVAAGPNPQEGPAKGLVRFDIVATHGSWLQLEGRRYAAGATGTLHRPPGTYTVLVGHDSCPACTRALALKIREARRYSVTMKMADAHLRVLGTPASAKIRVAGHVESPGTSFPIRMRQPRDAFQLSISAPGYQTVRRTIKLTVGERRTLSVPMERAPPSPANPPSKKGSSPLAP